MSAKPKAPKTASLVYEHFYMRQGKRSIVGIDEAGRGAWAGPVAVGAVSLPVDNPELMDLLAGVRDSKQMSARQRSGLVDQIKSVAICWGIGSASSDEIDSLGINPATNLAKIRALACISKEFPGFSPDFLLLDAMKWEKPPIDCEYLNIKRGDMQSLSIAAASVLAKVWRDNLMCEFDTQYPDYEFSSHKGYGTAKHRKALETYGVLPIHRTYYKPIQALGGSD